MSPRARVLYINQSINQSIEVKASSHSINQSIHNLLLIFIDSTNQSINQVATIPKSVFSLNCRGLQVLIFFCTVLGGEKINGTVRWARGWSEPGTGYHYKEIVTERSVTGICHAVKYGLVLLSCECGSLTSTIFSWNFCRIFCPLFELSNLIPADCIQWLFFSSKISGALIGWFFSPVNVKPMLMLSNEIQSFVERIDQYTDSLEAILSQRIAELNTAKTQLDGLLQQLLPP